MLYSELNNVVTQIKIYVVVARINKGKCAGICKRELTLGKSVTELVKDITLACGCKSAYCGTYSKIENNVFTSEIFYVISTYKEMNDEVPAEDRYIKIIEFNVKLDGNYFDRIESFGNKNADSMLDSVRKDILSKFTDENRSSSEISRVSGVANDEINEDKILEYLNKKEQEKVYKNYYFIGRLDEKNQPVIEMTEEEVTENHVLFNKIFASSMREAKNAVKVVLEKKIDFYKQETLRRLSTSV